MHEREDLGIGRLGNSLAGVQEIEFHEESHARKLCTELLDEVGLRHRRATRGNQVVNNKHHIVLSSASVWISRLSVPYSSS